MKIKQLLVALTFSLVSCLGQAANVPIVTIKSELSSPVLLENSQQKTYLKISLTGTEQKSPHRSPINLSLVIDRSTSMGGDRIEKARQAAIMAVNLLGENDTLSIVAYDSGAEIIQPAIKVKNKAAIITKINQNITPRGMTALFAGVSKGLNQTERYLNREHINRIILLSDGQANVGPTSITELSELSRLAAKKGIAITTIGLGSGYNEDLMTSIAGYSDGNHMFVDNAADLETAFSREFDDVMSVVAQNVTVTIQLDKDARPVRLLGRDGKIEGNQVSVKLNQLYSNQEKYVLLEVLPASGKNSQHKELASVSVNYDNLTTKKQEAFNQNVTVRYSKSQEMVKQAVDEAVLADYVVQESALANEKAIQLLDAGKPEEAKKVIDKNISWLSSQTYFSENAMEKVQEQAEVNRAISAEMDVKSGSSVRKSIKEKSYATKNQQKK